MADVTYYFNAYAEGVEEWATNPEKMVDGTDASYASTSSDGDVQKLTGNTCPATDLGTITKVELRFYGYGDADDQCILRPVFAGGDGANHVVVPGTTPEWKAYQNITTDANAPSPWTWAAIQALDCDVEFNAISKGNTMYVGEVEVRVTYWVPPESDIDVGSAPIDRPSSFVAEYTFINKDNPANANGTLSSIKIWANANMEGLVVGTFYTTNGNTLKCRDSEQPGDGTVAAGAERTFTGLSITVQTGDYIGCYYTVGTIEETGSGFAGVWSINSENIDPNDEAEYSLISGDTMSLYGYGDVGGENYPISLSPGLTASATVAYAVAWDRGMSPGLTATLVIARALAYDRGTSPGLTVSATIAKSLGRLITTTANLTVSSTVARYMTYTKATTSNLAVSATIVKGWGRKIATIANLVVSTTIAMSKGFVRAVIPNLTASATVSKAVAYKRATTPGLTVSATIARIIAYHISTQSALSMAVSIVKSFGRTITTSSGLTISATVLKSWGRAITTSPGLTVSATISRVVAYKRAVSSGLTTAVTIAKSFGKMITTASNLSISTTISRVVAYKRATQSALSVAVSVARSFGRTITTTANLVVSVVVTAVKESGIRLARAWGIIFG